MGREIAPAGLGSAGSSGGRVDPIALLRPGLIVAVWVPPVWHEGIVSDRRGEDGRPLVISCSRRAGEAREEPWAIFAAPDRAIAIVGYPSDLPSRVVVARARAELGRKWSITRNCEAFARSAHGQPGSPTVHGVAWLIAGACCFLG